MSPTLRSVPDNVASLPYKAADWTKEPEGIEQSPEVYVRRACADFDRAVLEANIILSKAYREFADRVFYAQANVRRAVLESRLEGAVLPVELAERAEGITDTDPSEWHDEH